MGDRACELLNRLAFKLRDHRMNTRQSLTLAALLCSIAFTATAQTPSAQDGASAASPAAASSNKAKRKERALVTGGPGYVSEAGLPPASSASTGTEKQPMKKRGALVTGGPGGIGGIPEERTKKHP